MSPAESRRHRGLVVRQGGEDVAALVEIDAERLSMPSFTGSETHRQSARSASSDEFGAGERLGLFVDLQQCSFLQLAVLAEKFCVATGNSRFAPSAWLEDVRILGGQFGQDSPCFHSRAATA